MANSNQRVAVPTVYEVIDNAEPCFNKSTLSFEKEQLFAYEAFNKNAYLAKVATNNITSLKIAMNNLAVVGLSLNPNTRHAYLIPRRIKDVPIVILEISYKGLIEIAVKSGSIKSCAVTLIREKDLETFQWIDNFTPPNNVPNPFASNRGNIVGGYCQARLPDGSYLLHAMTLEDVFKRRDCSEMVKKNGVSGPWLDWEEEMIMKTIVKQAANWWPSLSLEFTEAQRVLNVDNGEGLPEENRVNHVIEGEFNSAGRPADQLPTPPSRSDVAEAVVSYVDKAVARAKDMNAWQACEDHFKEKFKNLQERSYALHVLTDMQATA